MTQYEQLAASFYRRIDCIAGAVDLLAPGLATAAQRIVSAVLSDKRLLLCGSAQDSGLVSYSTRLLRRPGDSLPTLPALLLGGADETAEHLWQDVRSLSRDGDLLLCIDSSESATIANGAAAIAEQRNLVAVLLSANAGFSGGSTAIELRAENDELRRELALMTMHELRGQVLRLLMGE